MNKKEVEIKKKDGKEKVHEKEIRVENKITSTMTKRIREQRKVCKKTRKRNRTTTKNKCAITTMMRKHRQRNYISEE